MSLALIEEAAKEARRLAIAGSALAVGDFRLKKLIPPLEQAGTTVPVFGQVAKAISHLVNGSEADSAARLLALSTLLNAIRYTQGQTSADGAFRELAVLPCNCVKTRTPARILRPLVQALTTTGAGRLETVKSAVERGAFDDLRLIDPAIQALGDTFPELADLVAEQVLPGYGPGIVPRLRNGLDLKGKKADARRLAVMHRLDPGGAVELCKSALEEGSPEVKAAAIACLGKHEDCLALVMEQTKSRNQAMRAAALEALAEHDRPEIVSLFTELVKGKALDLLVRPFRALRNRQVLNSLLAEGSRAFELALKGDADQVPRFWGILECIEQRLDADAEEFLLRCFTHAEKLARVKAAKGSVVTGAEVLARLALLLEQAGSPRTFEALLAKRDLLPPSAFPQVLGSALRTWPADKVFLEFSPLLREKKGAGRDRSQHLQSVIVAAHAALAGDPGPLDENGIAGAERDWLKAVQWDTRWLDAAIQADLPALVCALARPGHEDAVNYLVRLKRSKAEYAAGEVVAALARCGYPKVTEHFLELVAGKAKGATYLDYEFRSLLQSARCLPPADLPRLDAFAATLEEKFVDAFLEELAPLRSPARPG